MIFSQVVTKLCLNFRNLRTLFVAGRNDSWNNLDFFRSVYLNAKI